MKTDKHRCWGGLTGIIAVVLLACCIAGPLFASEAISKPNILIITLDNLGYSDLPCFNADSEVIAPNFDRLSAEGARLTNFYTASPTCTVSRACLLTGRIARRHGLTKQLPGIEGNYGRGLALSEILIPQVLSKAGYATGCFGKWNIGFAPGSRPTERGFDEFFGHASGNIDYYTHVYNGKHDMHRGIEEAYVEGYAPDLFADAAIDFIDRQQSKPWFVYLPFNSPHFPNQRNKAPGEEVIWQAPDEAFEAYGYGPQTRDAKKRYRAVLTALDLSLGRVLDYLKEVGADEKTFVFVFSDNGAFMLEDRGLEVSSNAPLRNGGVTCWEGGLRVAAWARWPGHIEEGSTIEEPLWSPDLMIACAGLSESNLPKDRQYDGRDPLPVLTAGAESPHQSLHFEYHKHAALRKVDWKIVRTKPTEPWQLFNLADDLGETTNLAETHQEKLMELVGEFNGWQ